tara:strand:+ start:2560 stop:3810 length:1251 start_codon:yes stop_codon:yes gene_type:complete
MALSFGENLGVLGNIKLTDVKLVAGAFRTIASGSDTGSITVQRVEDGQIIYIQSEDRLIKASKSGATVNWSDFSFPSSGSTGNFETITVGGGTFTSESLASGGVSSFSDLTDIPSGIVSASVLSSPSQGTIRLSTNGNNTDVDSGLQSSDIPTFAGLTIQGDVSASGDIIAENYILKSSVTEVTTSFSSGSTIFGDTFNDTHQFTGSLFSSGSVTAPSFSGIFIGALSSSAQISTDISGSFTAASSSFDTRITNATSSILGLKTDSGSFDTRITNATSSIAGLKVDSGSFSTRITNATSSIAGLVTRVTTLENTPGGIFQPTSSIQSTTNNLQVTGSITVTNTGSFGLLLQNSEIVASPSIYNTNQTTALEFDGNGDLQFVDSNFTASKFLVDTDFELDSDGNFQQKIKLGDYFGS